MNRVIIYLMLLVPGALLAQAQHKAEILGKILSSDGKPIEGITVRLQPQNITTSTRSNGSYQFKSLKPGQAKLAISAIGIQPHEQEVEITDGKNRVPDIYLIENQATLQEIVINGKGNNKFTRKQSLYVSKMPLKNMENAQSYAVVTKELLKSQVNTN
ncbi:MAG TPA: hypothetical protein DEF78_16765 [Sphingobacterium sp.]|nr:hypothetical protein [Sphingobacterium sp.]